MQITLRGKRYTVEFPARVPGGVHGLCDSPKLKGRKILIKRSLIGQRRLEVIIHEALHACMWDIDEEAVDETAHDIARLLWRVGYRSSDGQ